LRGTCFALVRLAGTDAKEGALSEDPEQERADVPGRHPHYRMGAVTRMTGLSAHTIRVWERRYGAIQPSRSPGGDRLYSEEEVARLKLLHQLKQAGHSIGTVANLPVAELERILGSSQESVPAAAQTDAEFSLAGVQSRFLAAIRQLDTHSADRVVAQLAGALELRQLIYDFFVPILEQVGTLWSEGRFTVAQEHAASALIRNQLALLLRLYPGPAHGRCLVVGTPRNEWHEFGALLVALLAGAQGWRVVYLGANLPAEEIARAAVRASAEKVLLSWVNAEREATLAELTRLRGQIDAEVSVLVGGRASRSLAEAPSGVTLVSDLQHLERLLALH
jgi:MerR family transcriptional regulator, light-induced transcriptional regulator